MVGPSGTPHRSSSPARRGKAGRQAASAILCGAVLAFAAACSSSGTPASPKASPAANPQNAARAITAAAQTSRQISSVAASITEHATGGTSADTSGTVHEQLKPALAMSMHLTATVAGQSTTMDGLITKTDIYLKVGALANQLGKPWIQIPLSAVSDENSSIGQLFQNLTKGNPVMQTALFTEARNARAVGTQIIDGVSTTQYAGSFAPPAALADLPANLRRELAPALRTVQGDVQFNVWIDGRHQFKQVTETEQVNGTTLTTTVLITAINQPVHLTAPPAGQVARLPAGALPSI